VQFTVTKGPKGLQAENVTNLKFGSPGNISAPRAWVLNLSSLGSPQSVGYRLRELYACAIVMFSIRPPHGLPFSALTAR